MKLKVIMLLATLALSMTSLCYSYDVGTDLIWGNMIPYDHWESDTHDVGYDGVVVYVGSNFGKTDNWYFQVGGIFLELHADRFGKSVSGESLGFDLALRRLFKVSSVRTFVGINVGLSHLDEKVLPDLYGHTVGHWGVSGGIIFPISKTGWFLKYEIGGRHRSNPFEGKEFGWNTIEHHVGAYYEF